LQGRKTQDEFAYYCCLEETKVSQKGGSVPLFWDDILIKTNDQCFLSKDGV